MRKRFYKSVLAIVLVFSVALPMSVNAAVISDEQLSSYDENTVTPRRVATSRTVTDSGNNRYTVNGTTTVGGASVVISTGYRVSYYYGGTAADKDRVNKYTKSLSAYSNISLSGGGANSLGRSSYTGKTGESNELTYSQAYLYTVVSAVTTHKFSCNGGSISFSTYD